jgi:hypothetical protein
VTANGGDDERDDGVVRPNGVRAESGRRGPSPFTADEVDEALTDLLFGEPYEAPRPRR